MIVPSLFDGNGSDARKNVTKYRPVRIPTDIADVSTAYSGTYLLMIAYSNKAFFDEAIRRRNGTRG